MLADSDTTNWLGSLADVAVRFNEPMNRRTSFRIGGPADVFAEPGSVDALINLLNGACHRQIPIYVVGGGTNLLVSDTGIRGIVIGLIKGFNAVGRVAEKYQFQAGAGVSTRKICRLALHHKLEGINFAIGIPGTIGGALAMNAGTGSGTMQDVVQSVTLVTFDGRVWRVDKANLTFEYRKALWNSREISGQAIILETTLALQPGDPEKLKKEAQKLATFRKLHQPVGKACAGSFFKNPESGPPAGALIDRAGLKGKTVGGAMISEKHANFIINTGHATARDVLDLMNHVQETVYRRFGVGLSPEVRILGD